jgi:hypothetical protein
LVAEPSTPHQPDRRHKCHATAVNRQGWLTATAYALCGEPCVVNQHGDDTVRVVLTNDSPLQYNLVVRGRCGTGGIAYRDEEGDEVEVWAPNPIHIDGRRKSRMERTRQVGGRLVARRNRDNEQLEIEVGWSCVTHKDEDTLSPSLTIQVDARRKRP